MPDLTQPDPVDVALQTLLNEPSYAAQMLGKVAGLLMLHPGRPMNGIVRERAIDIAAEAILSPLPEPVSQDSISRMYRALPDMPGTITRAEYALLLRRAAKNLDTVGGGRS